jgi:hypothetical protein
MGVTVISVAGTLEINDGNTIEYANKETVIITASGNDVSIQWDETHFATYVYTAFSNPTGASASLVADAIATLVNT